MSVYLLDLIELIRERLDDEGGDTSAPPTGYYRRWQYDDSICLWKNTEIVKYLKRGLRDVASRAPIQEEGIQDDEPDEQCRLTVTANDPEVIVPSHVLTIEQVRLVSSGRLLDKTTSARLEAEFGSNDWASTTGTPDRYLEPRAGYLRLYPIPDAADEVRLIVRRGFSLEFEWEDVATAESADEIELTGIPDELEEAIICATCRYAYLKRDADTFSLDLSREYERMLTDLVGPPVSFRQMEARRANANLSVSIRGYSYNRAVATADEGWP